MFTVSYSSANEITVLQMRANKFSSHSYGLLPLELSKAPVLGVSEEKDSCGGHVHTKAPAPAAV